MKPWIIMGHSHYKYAPRPVQKKKVQLDQLDHRPLLLDFSVEWDSFYNILLQCIDVKRIPFHLQLNIFALGWFLSSFKALTTSSFVLVCLFLHSCSESSHGFTTNNLSLFRCAVWISDESMCGQILLPKATTQRWNLKEILTTHRVIVL